MPNAVPYGFYDLQSKFGNRANTLPPREVNDAVDKSITQHTVMFNSFLGILVKRLTDPTLRYNTPGYEELQPGDENGHYLSTQGGSFYDVGFPVQQAGSAMGFNRITGAKLSVEDVSRRVGTLIKADQTWVWKRALAALFYNQSWTFIDKEKGTLTVQPLANNDGTLYYKNGGAGSSQDNHYYAQAADISDAANPFTKLRKMLTEHPENAGEVVVFIASNLVEDVQGLAGFKEYADPQVRPGLANDVLVGTLDKPVPGKLIGRVNQCWIVEWDGLDDSYGFATTTEGEAVVGMREHGEAELQGFIIIGADQKVPFTELQFERLAGFGIWNRLGAVAFFIGSANYAPPARFAALPIP